VSGAALDQDTVNASLMAVMAAFDRVAQSLEVTGLDRAGITS